MKKIRLLTFLAALTITVSALGACNFGGSSSSSSSDDSTNSSSSSVSGSEDSGSSSGNESSSDNSSTHTHSYTLEKADETHHWTECECGEATEKVAHVFTDKKDETHHWTECECGEATEKVAHVFTDKKDETHHWTECECGEVTEKVAHSAAQGAEWKKDGENHWKECECGAQVDKGVHAPDPNGDAVINDETHAGTCVCGTAVNPTAHDYTVTKSDETQHWKECVCGKVDENAKEAHSYALDKKDETYHWTECECGEATEKVAHVFTDKKDETHHWTECECGEATEKVAHVFADKKDETYHWTECECGEATEKVAHVFADKKDETHHWTECECGEATEKVAHGAAQDAEWKTNETHHWKECECGAEVEKGEHAESEAVLNAEKTAFVVTCVGCGKELSQTEAVTISFANCEKEAIVLPKGGVATVVEPERDGYTFGGWHTQDTWGLYAEESTVDLEALIEADVMLYATWLKDGEDYVQAIHETIALISLVDIAESDVNEYFHYPVTLKTLELNLTEYEAENIQFEDVSAKIAEIKTACGDTQATAVLFEVKDNENDTDAYRASLIRSYYAYDGAWYYRWEHGGMNPQYNTDNSGQFLAEFPIKVNVQRAYIADGENVSFVQEGTENSTRIVDYKFVLRATNFKAICENYGYAFWNIRANRAMSVNVYGQTFAIGVNEVLPLMVDKEAKLYVKGDYVATLPENVFNGVDNGTDADPEGLTVTVAKTTEELYAQVEFSNVLCAYQAPVFEKVIVDGTNTVVAATIDYSSSGLNTEAVNKMYNTAIYTKGGVFTGANTFTLPNLKIGERGYILFGLTVREADRGVTYKLSHTGAGAETITLFTTNTAREECMLRVNADGSVLVNGTAIDFAMPESVILGNEQIILTVEITSASWTNVHMLSCIYGANAQKITVLKDQTHTLAIGDLTMTGANGELSWGEWQTATSQFEDGIKINVQAYKVNDAKVKAEDFVFTMKKLVYAGYETTFQVAMNQGGKLTFGATEITLTSNQKLTILVKADGSVYVDGTVVESYTLASDVMSGQTAWSFGVFNDTLADDGTSNGTAPYGEFHISKTVSQKVAVTE